MFEKLVKFKENLTIRHLGIKLNIKDRRIQSARKIGGNSRVIQKASIRFNQRLEVSFSKLSNLLGGKY